MIESALSEMLILSLAITIAFFVGFYYAAKKSDLKKIDDVTANKLRSEGVDMFADYCLKIGRVHISDPSVFRIREFAKKLRCQK